MTKFIKFSHKYNVELNIYDNPLFIEINNDLDSYHIKKTNYLQTSFYIWQRLNILVDNDKPLYGSWSFDSDNRNKFDKSYVNHDIKINNNKYI